jgi:hypothetical protein
LKFDYNKKKERAKKEREEHFILMGRRGTQFPDFIYLNFL